MCIHFKLHHPYSLKSYSIRQIDADHYYFDDAQTKKRVNDFVDDNLLPLNEILVTQSKGRKLNARLSITGITIELLKQYRLDALESLQELIKSNNLNIIQNSYYNSMSEYFSLSEYKEQVQKHSLLVCEVFGKNATRNLCHDNHTFSKSLSVDYAAIKSETDLQNTQQLIEKTDRNGPVNAQFNYWNKGYDKRLLQKLYGLEKLVRPINDASLLNDWRRLQDALYYQADAAQDSQLHIKNILSDFEIVSIKKYLTKIKRKQRDIPVIL